MLFVGLHAKAYIVLAAYWFLRKSWKTESVIQYRLEFLKAVRFGRYVLNDVAMLFVGLLTRAYIVWSAYSFLGQSLKIKSVVQHRLEFLKAVRFGRYVLNERVWWASCEGLHSLGCICFLRRILEKQIYDPASADFWRPPDLGDTVQTNLFVGLLMRANIFWAAYVFLGKSLKIKSVRQRRLDFLKTVRFGRYVLNDLVLWASYDDPHSLGRIYTSR